MLLSPFLPQIYHKLNLLKIMVVKCMSKALFLKLFSMNTPNTRLKPFITYFELYYTNYLPPTEKELLESIDQIGRNTII